MKPAYLITLLASSLLAVSANAAWQRVGSAEKRPADQASGAAGGTKVSSSKGVGQPENLLSDDPTLAATLGVGASELVVALDRAASIDQVYLINDGTEGRVSVASSMDKKSWSPLTQSVYTAADRSITLKFAGAQSRYVKLQWDLSKGGSVRKLDIFGQRSDRDYKFSESTSGSTVNVSGGVGGSRVIYIHPSPVHGDEVGTKYGHFEFPESPEKFRTVIYDLGAERTLTEVGSVHSPRPVRFMAYAFEHELPETTDWRGRRSFDPAVFDSMKPVASLDDTRGVGYVRAKLTQSVKARYVALRWEPDYNPPAFVVGHTSIVVQGSNNPADQNGGGGGGGGGGEDSNSSNNNNNNPNTADNPNNFFNTPFANPFSIGTAGYAGQPGLPSGGPVAGDISQ